MNEHADIRSQSGTALWITAIVVLVAILVSGVCYVRATSNPQSLVGKVLRGEELPKANSSQPDWRESSLRPNEYRLTIDHVLDESDQMVVRLTIETVQPQWHAIWSRGTTWVGQSGGHAVSGTVDHKVTPDGYCSTNDILTATQISYSDRQFARMNLGGGATTMEVPLKTPMNRVLEITAEGGIYPVHEPIVIGNAFGVDVKLAVGERTKVDAMSETMTNSSVANGELE